MNLDYFKKDSKTQVWVCIDSLEDAGGTFWQAVLTIIGLKKNNFNVCCFLKFKPRDSNNYLKILLENNIYLSYPKNFLNDYYKLIKIIKPFAAIASMILFPLYYFRNRAYKRKKNVDFFKENSPKALFQYISNKINYHLDPNDHRKKILSYFQNINLFRFLENESNNKKPDLIHVFHQKGPENFINWAKKNNIKVIYSESSSADKNLPYYNNNFLSAVKNVDAIFAMSEKHAEKIKSNFDYNGKIFSNTPSMIISNGHYIKEKFMLAKKEKIVIGMAASKVCAFKGFDLTIKAVAVLSNEYNLILKLVGEEINQDFRILANSLNLKNVHFLGLLTPMDMSNFYKQIDILIIASKWEGLPTVMIEAMSFGIPVISTKVGEIPNFIKDRHDGLFFENDNYKDLAEKIDSLIQNEDLYANLSINSIDFSRNFYYENVVEKMIKNYKKVLS